MEVPESPTSRARLQRFRLHGGWISDTDYLGEIHFLCNEVGYRFDVYVHVVSYFIILYSSSHVMFTLSSLP